MADAIFERWRRRKKKSFIDPWTLQSLPPEMHPSRKLDPLIIYYYQDATTYFTLKILLDKYAFELKYAPKIFCKNNIPFLTTTNQLLSTTIDENPSHSTSSNSPRVNLSSSPQTLNAANINDINLLVVLVFIEELFSHSRTCKKGFT